MVDVVARREDFGKLLEPGLRKIFENVLKAQPEMRSEFYNMQTTDNPTEEDLSIGAMKGFPLFTGTISYDRMYQGYSVTYEFPERAGGFQVERKLFDDDRYTIINKRPAGLALAAARQREEDAVATFNNAFSGSYVGGDAKALCATDHPSPAPDGPAARSNKGAYALNHANLLVVRNLMKDTRDDRNNRIMMNPDTLLIPTGLYETAWELMQSEGKVNTADHNPNIHHGKYKLVEWNLLSSSTDWFMIDSRLMKLFLNWFERVPMEFAYEEDFNTLVARYRAYTRYNCGFSDWMWIYGNDV